MNILNVQLRLDEGEVDVSHDKEELVQEPKEDELVTKISQGDERNLWNVVKKEEEEIFVEDNDQHTEEMFEMSQVISEWLKILLKEVAINKMEMSQVFSETLAGINFLNYVMLTNMHRSVSDYVVAVRELKDKLIFEGKFAGNEQQLDISEGDAYKSIKEVRVATISRMSFSTISRELSRGIPRAISRVLFEAILKVKTEVKSREIEGNVQQFRS